MENYFSERKIKMKKDQDITERFAFHLVSSRDTALNIANDGLSCEQLSFTIDKYLGKFIIYIKVIIIISMFLFVKEILKMEFIFHDVQTSF